LWGLAVPIYPQPIPLVPVPPERRRRLPKRGVEGRAVGRLLSGRGFFFGGVCGGLKHAPIHLAWNYQLSCQIDLAHCSVTAHHMKHAPINLAWNYQLSHQLIWRGSKALRRAASHNELLLCHSTPHEQICKQLYALNIIHENYHKMDIHI